MAKPVLVIGNKNYSSWSLRPYMALAMAGIGFDEKLIRFGDPAFTRQVKRISAAGRVPILMHNGLLIWDSLAIMEYLAETWPEKGLWPKTRQARAAARSVSAEMHSGFSALRNACPMNLRRPPNKISLRPDVLSDVKRIEEIWRSCRKTYGKGGPFLFGKFTIADAMFAPVVSRLVTYDIDVKRDTKTYMTAVLESASFRSWQAAALKEPWIVPHDEVD